MILSDWTGRVAYMMTRCGITQQELAMECHVARTYVSRLLNKEKPSDLSKELIETGLRSCARNRGVEFEEVFPTQRCCQGADP